MSLPPAILFVAYPATSWARRVCNDLKLQILHPSSPYFFTLKTSFINFFITSYPQVIFTLTSPSLFGNLGLRKSTTQKVWAVAGGIDSA